MQRLSPVTKSMNEEPVTSNAIHERAVEALADAHLQDEIGRAHV